MNMLKRRGTFSVLNGTEKNEKYVECIETFLSKYKPENCFSNFTKMKKAQIVSFYKLNKNLAFALLFVNYTLMIVEIFQSDCKILFNNSMQDLQKFSVCFQENGAEIIDVKWLKTNFTKMFDNLVVEHLSLLLVWGDSLYGGIVQQIFEVWSQDSNYDSIVLNDDIDVDW